MGLVFADIELSNATDDSLRPTQVRAQVRAMVDSGALRLRLPQHVATQLGLARLDQRTVTTADGKKHGVDHVGPLKVRFANRQCLTGALVLGDETLLGAIPMEDMDVLIDPARQQLTVTPGNPNIPASVAMDIRRLP